MDIECVRAEIEQLHAFFVDWFAGQCGNTAEIFARGFTSQVTEDFELVTPDGERLGRDVLAESIFTGYGGNKAFRIRIEELRVRAITDELVVATYEEWQENAQRAGRADSARVSTAVFCQRPTARNGLVWLHVHETWLPAETSGVTLPPSAIRE